MYLVKERKTPIRNNIYNLWVKKLRYILTIFIVKVYTLIYNKKNSFLMQNFKY